jgi:hypothetical protein
MCPAAALGQSQLHLGAVVAMERIALDQAGSDLLAAEDVLERARDRVVPAPEEPVTAMIGCLADMDDSPEPFSRRNE